MLQNKRLIDHAAFQRRCSESGCGTLSQYHRPLSGETAWEADCTVKELLKMSLFPVSYLFDGVMSCEHWSVVEAKCVPYYDAIQRKDFLSYFYRSDSAPISADARIRVIFMECTTCRRIAVIDGNHRLTRMAVDYATTSTSPTVDIVCLSGASWPSDTPDLNRICACINALR